MIEVLGLVGGDVGFVGLAFADGGDGWVVIVVGVFVVVGVCGGFVFFGLSWAEDG